MKIHEILWINRKTFVFCSFSSLINKRWKWAFWTRWSKGTAACKTEVTVVDKEYKIFLRGCFITVAVIAYLLNWNFDSMADTATTLVSIAVGVYIAAASALLGSPYAKELKQITDKKRPSNTLLGTLLDYFRHAGKLGITTVIVSCLYKIPAIYNVPVIIARIGSAAAYGIFFCNILFLWLVFVFLVNSIEKSV